MNGGIGEKGGDTNEELVCPTFGSSGFEGQGETSNSKSRKVLGLESYGGQGGKESFKS